VIEDKRKMVRVAIVMLAGTAFVAVFLAEVVS
jgi:hypothetical protein